MVLTKLLNFCGFVELKVVADSAECQLVVVAKDAKVQMQVSLVSFPALQTALEIPQLAQTRH
jgi:hypothetical protein